MYTFWFLLAATLILAGLAAALWSISRTLNAPIPPSQAEPPRPSQREP